MREPLLSTPRHGWINLHFSLLPALARCRARAARADRGGCRDRRERVPAGRRARRGRRVRRDRPPARGRRHRGRRARRARRGQAQRCWRTSSMRSPRARPSRSRSRARPTYAAKLGDDDGRLRWDDPAAAVLGRIRGVTPEPGAHTTVDGARLKVLAAASRASGRAGAAIRGDRRRTAARCSSAPRPTAVALGPRAACGQRRRWLPPTGSAGCAPRRRWPGS